MRIVNSKIAFLGFSALIATACVTVNVNFPESAVQQATDDYVRDLYRAKERGKASPAPSSTGAAWEFSLIASAIAAEAPQFTVNTASGIKIRERLASRLDEVIAQKRAGTLGEDVNGMLVLRGGDKMKPLLKKKLEKLVGDENSDRKELYESVVKDNHLSTNRQIDVQKSFGRSFQAESPAGTWVEGDGGSWTQKK